jgi:nucleotide-binding universal stress UspA family protein
MYRRILVPVDGSSTSMLGLKHALGLARDERTRLRVLNVIDDMIIATAIDGYAAGDMSQLIDSLRESGEKALAQAAAMSRRAGVKSETVMVESRGRPVSAVILDQAAEWRADLIVMGTHGRRGLNRLLLGSDAERVLREAPVPVLLLRSEGKPAPRKRRRQAAARA